MGFFENLNFSSSNEDGSSELRALEGARKMLCITGSGTRPLDLLMSDAEEVIAFDVNPAQNALLALKIAGIEALDHADFLALTGVTEGNRLALYDQVRGALDPGMRVYWDDKRALIDRGTWYAGKWERILGWNAWALKLGYGRAVKELMEAPNVTAQADVWQARFSGSALRRILEFTSRRWVWKYILREPGGGFLPDRKEVGRRLERDFENAARSFLFRESDFASLILRGHHDLGALPIHLKPQNYARLKNRVGRIRIVRGELAHMSAADVAGVDGFSLSDFGSYCGGDVYAACWRGIMAAAAPDARFCERIFMHDIALPFDELHVDDALSALLSREDKAIIYQIRAGRIR
ncbi:MAG: DUF3419 family protein [Pseudomonadota bacterium]